MRRSATFAAAVVWSFLSSTSVALAQARFAQSWQDLGPRERYDALQNYRRHEQLPQERQQDVEKHYQRWHDMSPDERARVRQNYERLQQLPPQERERFQRKYKKWKGEGGADR